MLKRVLGGIDIVDLLMGLASVMLGLLVQGRQPIRGFTRKTTFNVRPACKDSVRIPTSGMKLAVNEFVGYLEFAKYLQPDTAVVLSEKTKAIITFALCGFANFSSIAILIGGIGGMAPNRRGDVARLGLKAVVAGTLANLMSATIAGLFIELSGVAM